MTYRLGQLAEIVGAIWLFLAASTLVAIAAGWIGNRVARKGGWMCPECDCRGSRADIVIHRIREHGNGR